MTKAKGVGKHERPPKGMNFYMRMKPLHGSNKQQWCFLCATQHSYHKPGDEPEAAS